MRVYHRTSPGAAAEILRTRRFVSLENNDAVYVSNRASGQAVGFGVAVVRLDVPAKALVLDDEFPDGERHFWLHAADVRPEWIVTPGRVSSSRELLAQWDEQVREGG